MRKLLLVSLLVSGPVLAANFWTAFKFTFNGSPVSAAIAELKEANDPVFEEINRRVPWLEQSYVQSLGDGFDVLTNQYAAPRAIFDRDGYYNEDVLMQFFQIARPPVKFYPRRGDLLASAATAIVPVSLRVMKAEKSHSYRFCEAFPNDQFCLDGFGYGERFRDHLGYIFARRIVSMPSFVEGMCSQAIPVFKWYLKWNELSSAVTPYKWRDNLTFTLDAVDRDLAEIYGDGTWSAKSNEVAANSDAKEFIFRRYLDGGPEAVKSMQKCVRRLRQEMTSPVDIEANENAGPIFEQILGLVPKGFINKPAHKIMMQSRFMDKYSLTQLTRLVELRRDIGTVADLGPEDRIDLNEAIALTTWMSLADAKYDYRVITADELKQTLPNLSDVCTVNTNYLLYGYKGLKLLLKGKDCTLLNLILVRDEK